MFDKKSDYYNEGLELSENGEYEKAITLFDKAIKQNVPGALFHKRVNLIRLGRYAEATQCLES